MSKTNKLLNEVEQEVSKNKAPSYVRLILMLVKSLIQELRELREFVNSPDSDDLNRHV
jgi:hypothetical protein